MTDTALVNANKRRDSLAAQINSLAQQIDDLKRDLAKVDAWIAQWREFAIVSTIAAVEAADSASMSGSVSSFENATEGAAELKRRRATGNPKKEEVAETAREIIQERGEPVSRADLFTALAKRDMIISSETDPEMVLSTMLWRMQDQVIRLKSGGYWLTERPWPPADYHPADTEELAKEFLATLDPDEVASLQFRMAGNQGIPPDADGKMLAVSRTQIRRDLTEREKRLLRKNLNKIIWQNVP